MGLLYNRHKQPRAGKLTNRCDFCGFFSAPAISLILLAVLTITTNYKHTDRYVFHRSTTADILIQVFGDNTTHSSSVELKHAAAYPAQPETTQFSGLGPAMKQKALCL